MPLSVFRGTNSRATSPRTACSPCPFPEQTDIYSSQASCMAWDLTSEEERANIGHPVPSLCPPTHTYKKHHPHRALTFYTNTPSPYMTCTILPHRHPIPSTAFRSAAPSPSLTSILYHPHAPQTSCIILYSIPYTFYKATDGRAMEWVVYGLKYTRNNCSTCVAAELGSFLKCG